MFKLSSDKELDLKILGKFLTKHKELINRKLQPLYDAYVTEYDVFKQAPKADWKPDNRIAANFAKYIIDTMGGYFIGVPIKTTSDDQGVADYIELLDGYNDQDDNNAELAKLCDIFGYGYELYFVDELGNLGITYVSPLDGFMIYDDSILENERYFVRIYIDSDNVLHGSVSDLKTVKYFVQKGKLLWDNDAESPDGKLHGFAGVPATEYRENAERIGLFEPVMSMINAYNKALSEKANDVDYFADAYLKIFGAAVDDDALKNIRDKRLLNFKGRETDNIVAEFLEKPDGDTTQEHLVDRLERLIFQIAMVANISDESFGTASGVALRYKLLAMSNLAKTKERKFTSGMNRRYMLLFSNPVSGMKANAWIGLKYKFTQNIPANLLEESEIANNLNGITSKKTQLSVLSVVEDVDGEIQQIAEEQDTEGYATDYPTNRTELENSASGDA